MGQNNDGIAGVDVENIAIEKSVFVGMQAPNTFPCMKIDENGRSLPKMEVASNGGTQVLSSSGYNCSYVDTSWLAHCGKFNVAVGNKITLTSGAGGFEVTTSGISKFFCRYTDFVSVDGFTLTTKLFTVSTTKRMELAGARFDLIYDENYIHGNTNFLRNVHINGGLYVNGELICQHITTQAQTNMTSMSDKTEAYLNPGQSFHIFNGASIAAKSLCQTVPWSLLAELPDSPAYIDCYIALMLPSPLDLINVPCKIAFPKGVSLLSDAVFTLQPQSSTVATQGANRALGGSRNKPDIKGPAHQHSFKGPACRYTEDTSELFDKAKEMTSNPEPARALGAVPNGLESLEMFANQAKTAAENEAKGWLSDMWDWINPFGAS